MKVRIKENSWIAKIAAARLKTASVAIVIGKTIYLYQCSREDFLNDTDWVCHELKHVEQYQRMGVVVFIIRYLFESLKNGYHNNKYEVEAREGEKETSLISQTEFV